MRYRSPRRPSNKRAVLVSERGVCPCQIINYSRTGLALRHLPTMRPGSPLTLRLLNRQFAATLIWQRDGIAGVQLVHALSDEEAQIFSPLGGRKAGSPSPGNPVTQGRLRGLC